MKKIVVNHVVTQKGLTCVRTDRVKDNIHYKPCKDPTHTPQYKRQETIRLVKESFEKGLR
jgi:hypothetical protein